MVWRCLKHLASLWSAAGHLVDSVSADQKSPQRWWFYTGLLAVPFLCLTMLIYPVSIDPLFTSFNPCKTRQSNLRSLPWPAGRASKAVAFTRSTKVQTQNAERLCKRFGSSKRIVLWDNTLRTWIRTNCSSSCARDGTLCARAHRQEHRVQLSPDFFSALCCVSVIGPRYCAFQRQARLQRIVRHCGAATHHFAGPAPFACWQPHSNGVYPSSRT